MLRTPVNLLFGCAALALFLCGCGGSSRRGGITPVPLPEGPGGFSGPTATARLTVAFPPRRISRIIPERTESILVTITGEGIPPDKPFIRPINRPLGPAEVRVDLTVPIGAKTFRAEAKDAPEGAGKTLASASQSVELKENEAQPLTLELSDLYTITDLGTLPGRSESGAAGISSNGLIVGFSSNETGVDDRAFLWTPETPNGPRGTLLDLGTLGGRFSVAYRVNSLGQVVGSSHASDGGLRAFRWSAATGMRNLGTLGGTPAASQAFGINEKGAVAGYVTTGTDQENTVAHPGVYTDGWNDLGTLGGDLGAAWDINDRGQVIGTADLPRQNPEDPSEKTVSHAFLWQNGQMVNLGVAPASVDSFASAINEVGQVIGFVSVGATEQGFLWTPDAPNGMSGRSQTLGASPRGINNLGEIVGYLGTAEQPGRAVLWKRDDAGVYHRTDLNDRIPPDSGWLLLAALDINDRGQIVGQGILGGKKRAVLLTPPQ